MNDKTLYLLLAVVIGAAIISILYAFVLLRKFKKMSANHEKIEEISSYIHEGTIAFLKREYKIIAIFIVGVAIFLSVLGFIPAFEEAKGVGWQAGICFIVGASFSALAGYLGMMGGIRTNSLTASAANTDGMSKALKMAFGGGTVMGLSVAGLGLLGLTGLFFIFYAITNDLLASAQVVAGYGLGASLVALFARVGGGIFTKAADVGADLVGKVESNIPEDDPRNPAVIADNVGDNVGDIAGMGSDLLESFVGSVISAITIGVTAAIFLDVDASIYAIYPILVAGSGIIASIVSILVIGSREWKDPQNTLSFATYLAAFVLLAFAAVFSYLMFAAFNPFLAILAGVIVGVLIGEIAEIYTSDKSKAVQGIAEQSQTGHATNVIAGYAVGMKSTALTIFVLVGGIVAAYLLNDMYGIGLAAVGMLATVGITVSVDSYGPISDNAGGIAQMAKLDPKVREITDKLDSVGNTTAAIGKGFCIGSAALTSLALFVSFASVTKLTEINVLSPLVIVGVLIGAMLPFWFTAITIKSVGKAANKMIEEVRRQFKEDPGIMAETSKPDYARCVDISTTAALKEMVFPGLLAILSPILMGFLFGVEALGGLLVGSLASGVMMAIFMANSGGAWDNAKKLIETGKYGGKGSEAHKAAVTGDTVGDPFKDTAGPAIDILIKLMAIISLVVGPAMAALGSGLLERFF